MSDPAGDAAGRVLRTVGQDAPAPHRVVYRWDLDKTYLRTEFDTLRDLLRTAFESPRRKRTVPGAATLLRELGATGPASVFVLSGSPESMRRALEAKLRLDGVRWDELVLKPSLRRLLQGDFRFLKDQLGYKLGALLRARAGLEPGVQEVLFGDDAEQDAFVYSLYAELCAGRMGTEELAKVLRVARLDEERHLPELLELAAAVPRAEAVRRIFIHLDRLSAPTRFEPFGTRLCAFFNYFQPAAVLVEEGLLPAASALRVGLELVERDGFSVHALAASLQDLVDRGQLGRPGLVALHDGLEAFGGSERRLFGSALGALGEALRSLRQSAPEVVRVTLPEVNFVRLYEAEQQRWRAAKARVRASRG